MPNSVAKGPTRTRLTLAVEPSQLAKVPLLMDFAATSSAADARVKRKRREDVRTLEEKSKPSQEVLAETEIDFKVYHRLGGTRPVSTACSTNEDLAALLQEERRQRAMPPLADAAALVARCPEVFGALARGEPLEPLVTSGHLTPSSSAYTSDSDRNLIRFYIREWTPTGETSVESALDKFGADHVIQRPFVEEAKTRPLQRIRYVGTYVDAGRSNRLHQDGIRSRPGADAERKKRARLLTFMNEHAPEAEWSSFVIEGLTVEVTTPEIMPVDALFAACGRAMFLRQDPGLMPVKANKAMQWRAVDATVAPIEAALIHCCQLGSVCFNASSYGGLDTLPALASHPEAKRLRREVIKICDKTTLSTPTTFDTALVATSRSQYDFAAWSAPAPVSARVVGFNALYASVPSRGLHVLHSIPADQVKGQATRFGPFAGPALAAFRNATTWALGYDEAREAEDVAHLKAIGASADFWCVDSEHTKEQLSTLRSTLKRVAAAHPEVFRTLVREITLEPLDASAAQNSTTLLYNDRHRVPFYICKWTYTRKTTEASALDKFAIDHTAQLPFVEEAKTRPSQAVRYVGMHVDVGPRNRLREHGMRARMGEDDTRIVSFMIEHAPEEEWRSYDIIGLTLNVPNLKIMPVDGLLASCGRSTFLDARVARLPVEPTKIMVAKAANAAAAPIEAALIHCCQLGSISLDAASYRSLDTRRQVDTEETIKERLYLMLSTLRKIAAARHSVAMLRFMVIHSSHVFQLLVKLRGLSDSCTDLDIKTDKMSAVVAKDFGSLVGDLFEVGVGSKKVACIAALHGGIIRRNGDAILRADRHLLIRYIALKTRLLEHFAAVEGKTAAEVIEATQQAAERMGLEPALVPARERVCRRTSAINSLTPLVRHANAAADA